MTSTLTARLPAAALMLCLCVTAARAEDAPATKEPPPVADKGTTAQPKCISENDGWTQKGRGVAFAIELTNTCERRMSCQVFAYVTSAKGAAQGHGRLVLAQASKGAAAKKTWTMPVKMSGGSSQSTRECRAM
jgi:hypothetical protein